MSTRTLNFSDEVIEYLRTKGLREPALLEELRQRTAALPQAGMQISPEQGALMSSLIRLLGARRTLEVGTFTGYSALVVALALREGGKVVACDVSEEWTAIGREFWARAGVGDRIELHLGPAVETLDSLIVAAGEPFDFAFIDADKSNYDIYYERCLELIRPGGVIAVDNVLWGGSVVDESRQDEDVVAIRALNDKIHGDERVEMCMLPVGDGLTLAIKR